MGWTFAELERPMDATGPHTRWEDLMKLKTIFIAVLFFVGSAASALAQMATVKGTLKDQNGPVVGAVVTLKDNDTGRKYPLKSDKKGEFMSIGVTPGKFDISVTKDGKV